MSFKSSFTTTAVVGNGASGVLRRRLYRQSKRLLIRLMARRWPGRRPALESAARGFLRDQTRSYLARVVGDRGFALAAAAAIMLCMASTTARALPPIELSDVAAGSGGFVINGIEPYDRSGRAVSGAGDVNGDGLADVIVGAFRADPGGNSQAGESYVVFGPVDLDLEEATRLLSDIILGLDLSLFNGPNDDANAGLRNALANRATDAANAIAINDIEGAIDDLASLLAKIDDVSPPFDWMDASSEKTALASDVNTLIVLLLLAL